MTGELSDGELGDLAIEHRVTDQNSYEAGGSALTTIKQRIRALEAEQDAERTPLERQLGEIHTRYQQMLLPLRAAEQRVKETMATYSDVAKANGVPVRRAAGTSTRTTWRAEVTDLRALVEAAASERVMLNLIQSNTKELNRLAREKKETLQIPGVIAVSNTTIAASPH